MTPFPGVLVRRKLALELGGFDERWGPLADYEFWYRLAGAGPVEVVRAIGAFYRVSPGQWTEREWGRMLGLTHLLRLRIVRERFAGSPRLGRWLARFFTARNAQSYAERFPERPAALRRALRFNRIPLASLPSGWVWAALKGGRPAAQLTMRVTVAIPTHNRAEFLRQTLAGLATQDFPADQFEVLVIDNNSTDDTAAVVAACAGKRPAPRWILETRSRGLDHARNRALAEARGEIVLFGDDDILVESDWITRMVAPWAGADAARIGAVGGEVIPIFPDGLPPWIAEWHGPLAFRAEAGPVRPNQSPMGANLAFPRRVFRELGPFHTGLDRTAGSYFSGGDSEMIRRLRTAGLEVWFAPAAAVRHQMPASRTTFRYAARHAFDSARSRVIDRAAAPGARAYLLSRLPANAAKAAGFALLALGQLLLFRGGAAKKALVRSWRSCGYIYQIPRSLAGQIVVTPPLPLSVIIVARNEADNLARCLASVRGWAAEIDGGAQRMHRRERRGNRGRRRPRPRTALAGVPRHEERGPRPGGAALGPLPRRR